MDDKLKNTENDAQIIREEDLSAYRAKGIYMRDHHCHLMFNAANLLEIINLLSICHLIQF